MYDRALLSHCLRRKDNVRIPAPVLQRAIAIT